MPVTIMITIIYHNNISFPFSHFFLSKIIGLNGNGTVCFADIILNLALQFSNLFRLTELVIYHHKINMRTNQIIIYMILIF